jgi:hypothetical protein
MSLVSMDLPRQLISRDDDTATFLDEGIHFHETTCALYYCVCRYGASTFFFQAMPSTTDFEGFRFHLNLAQNHSLKFYERSMSVQQVLEIWEENKMVLNERI